MKETVVGGINMKAVIKKTGEEIIVSSYGCGMKNGEYGHLYSTGGKYNPGCRIFLESELELKPYKVND